MRHAVRLNLTKSRINQGLKLGSGNQNKNVVIELIDLFDTEIKAINSMKY